VAAVAVVLLAVSLFRRGDGPLLRAGLGAGALALVLVPVVASVLVVARGQGAFDTPFEAAGTARSVDQQFVAIPQLVTRTLPDLERARAGAPDLMAVQSAAVASVFGYATGEEVLPIGGFTGTQPEPSLPQLRADIARGAFHLVLAFPGDDPRLVWIDQHCRPLPSAAPPLQNHYCVPADAAG
jgi:hypothetical protein